MIIAIDAPPCYPGEKRFEHDFGLCIGRCLHDMLAAQCSWCKGLPDVPNIDSYRLTEPIETVLWYPAEVNSPCAKCGEQIKVGRPVMWSPLEGGVVGRCCEDEI